MNIGVIGLGYWGPNLVRNFLSHSEVKEVWGYDIDNNRMDAIANRLPSLKLANSFEHCLELCDAMVIATPVAEHFSQVQRALESGKHVLVEKPFTTTAHEGDQLVNLAAEKGLKLMVDHTFVFTSAVSQLRDMIQENQLGEVLYFDSVRINLGLFRRDCNVLWDLAYHDLSILLALFPDKKPIRINAHGRDHFDQGMANLAYLTLNYPNGFLAGVHVSWLAPVKHRKIILGGSKKMVVYDDMEVDEKIKVYDKGVEVIDGVDQIHERLVQYRIGDIHVPKIPQREALYLVADNFIHSIKTGEEPITSGAKSLEIVRILEAAELSMSQLGKPISLED